MREPALTELLANLRLFESMRKAVLNDAATAYTSYRQSDTDAQAQDAMVTYRRAMSWLTHYAETGDYL